MYWFASVTKKIGSYLGDVLEDRRDKLQENMQVNGGKYSYSKTHVYITIQNKDADRWMVWVELNIGIMKLWMLIK